MTKKEHTRLAKIDRKIFELQHQLSISLAAEYPYGTEVWASHEGKDFWKTMVVGCGGSAKTGMIQVIAKRCQDLTLVHWIHWTNIRKIKPGGDHDKRTQQDDGGETV